MSAPNATPPVPYSAPTLSMRWRGPAIVFALIGLGTWLVLPRVFAVNPINALRAMRWEWVLLAVVAQLGMQLGRGLLLYGIVSGGEARLTRRRAALVVLGASSVGLLGGGYPGFAAAMYRWTRACNVPAASAAMGAWMPSLLLSAAVATMALASSALLLLTNPAAHVMSSQQVVRVVLGLVVVLGAIGYLLARLRDRTRRMRWVERALRGWARLRRRPFDGDAVTSIATQMDTAWQHIRRRSWWVLALTAVLTACSDLLSVWALVHAVDSSLSLTSVSAAWGVPQLLGNASLLPGGAGVVELTMTPLLVRLGVAAAPALAVVLGYRALSFWVPMVTGLPLIVWLERRK